MEEKNEDWLDNFSKGFANIIVKAIKDKEEEDD